MSNTDKTLDELIYDMLKRDATSSAAGYDYQMKVMVFILIMFKKYGFNFKLNYENIGEDIVIINEQTLFLIQCKNQNIDIQVKNGSVSGEAKKIVDKINTVEYILKECLDELNDKNTKKLIALKRGHHVNDFDRRLYKSTSLIDDYEEFYVLESRCFDKNHYDKDKESKFEWMDKIIDNYNKDNLDEFITLEKELRKVFNIQGAIKSLHVEKSKNKKAVMRDIYKDETLHIDNSIFNSDVSKNLSNELKQIFIDRKKDSDEGVLGYDL